MQVDASESSVVALRDLCDLRGEPNHAYFLRLNSIGAEDQGVSVVETQMTIDAHTSSVRFNNTDPLIDSN